MIRVVAATALGVVLFGVALLLGAAVGWAMGLS
jgi:hypothetical protein